MRGKSVCDIGCGSGRFVDELASRGASRLVGVDVAPEMLKIARELVARSGNSQPCEFLHSDVLDWKTDQKFDITIAIGFWDYIAHPPERLRIIRGLTRGKFLSAWPRFWTWRMPVRKARLAVRGCPVYFFRKPGVFRDAGRRRLPRGPVRHRGQAVLRRIDAGLTVPYGAGQPSGYSVNCGSGFLSKTNWLQPRLPPQVSRRVSRKPRSR